jgi:hypothetical protein
MESSFIDMKRYDIQLPIHTTFQGLNSILTNLDRLLIDIILYLAYGIALVSGLKFVINIVNGFASNSHMGA